MAFNKLTFAEAERIALLMEECGEVIQSCGKILRHGYESTHPEGGPTNRQSLEIELGHVMHAHARMCIAKDLDNERCVVSSLRKSRSVAKYLHHQPRR